MLFLESDARRLCPGLTALGRKPIPTRLLLPEAKPGVAEQGGSWRGHHRAGDGVRDPRLREGPSYSTCISREALGFREGTGRRATVQKMSWENQGVGFLTLSCSRGERGGTGSRGQVEGGLDMSVVQNISCVRQCMKPTPSRLIYRSPQTRTLMIRA